MTLDTGALIAFERTQREMVAIVVRAKARGDVFAIPAGVVAQVWRDGRRQARLAQLLASDVVNIEPLDDTRAREAGQLCGISKTRDSVDASVVLCAKRHGHVVMTSDIGDLRRLDTELTLVGV